MQRWQIPVAWQAKHCQCQQRQHYTLHLSALSANIVIRGSDRVVVHWELHLRSCCCLCYDLGFEVNVFSLHSKPLSGNVIGVKPQGFNWANCHLFDSLTPEASFDIIRILILWNSHSGWNSQVAAEVKWCHVTPSNCWCSSYSSS